MLDLISLTLTHIVAFVAGAFAHRWLAAKAVTIYEDIEKKI